MNASYTVFFSPASASASSFSFCCCDFSIWFPVQNVCCLPAWLNTILCNTLANNMSACGCENCDIGSLDVSFSKWNERVKECENEVLFLFISLDAYLWRIGAVMLCSCRQNDVRHSISNLDWSGHVTDYIIAQQIRYGPDVAHIHTTTTTTTKHRTSIFLYQNS